MITRSAVASVVLAALLAAVAGAQAAGPDPVFGVRLLADREPVVAGGELRLAVELTVDRGWHVNSDDPGDEFSMPTTLEWRLPDGWTVDAVDYPAGRTLSFAFAESPIEVWEERVVIVAALRVPAAAAGRTELGVTLTAQACNDSQCLPPLPVKAVLAVDVAPAGTASAAGQQRALPGARGRAAGPRRPPPRGPSPAPRCRC